MELSKRQAYVILGALCLLVQTVTAQTETNYIDVHVHLRGTTKPRRDPGLRPNRRGPVQKETGKTQENNLQIAAENLIRKMDQHGIQQALVVVVPGQVSYENEENSMRQVVMRYPGRLKLLAGGAILSPYLQNISPEKVTDADRSRFYQIATQILQDGAVGFGEMISYHLSMADHHSFQYAPPDHPLFLLLADIAAQHNVAIDLHMEAIVKRRSMPENLLRASDKNPNTLEPTIPALERMLEHNRKARIVWQHIGWDNTGDMTSELLNRLLSTHSNLYIALRVENRTQQVGNGPSMPNRLIDEKGRLNPEWLTLIKKFPDRMTIGSDEFFFKS